MQTNCFELTDRDRYLVIHANRETSYKTDLQVNRTPCSCNTSHFQISHHSVCYTKKGLTHTVYSSVNWSRVTWWMTSRSHQSDTAVNDNTTSQWSSLTRVFRIWLICVRSLDGSNVVPSKIYWSIDWRHCECNIKPSSQMSGEEVDWEVYLYIDDRCARTLKLESFVCQKWIESMGTVTCQ